MYAAYLYYITTAVSSVPSLSCTLGRVAYNRTIVHLLHTIVPFALSCIAYDVLCVAYTHTLVCVL